MKLSLFIIINLSFILSLHTSQIKLNNDTCSISNCPYPNGICENNECECNSNYVTLYTIDSNNNTVYNTDKHLCDYKKKSQIKAFLLELFFPFGIGHYYINNYLLGTIKLLLFLLLCTLGCVKLTYKDNIHSIKKGLLIKILSITLLLSVFIWEIIDLVIFGINGYTDNNDVDLENW